MKRPGRGLKGTKEYALTENGCKPLAVQKKQVDELYRDVVLGERKSNKNLRLVDPSTNLSEGRCL
jgi:hypothetical protein